MNDFGVDMRRALRPRPLPWYRRWLVSLRIGLALLRIRLAGVPKVPDEVFERSARKYRADKSLP